MLASARSNRAEDTSQPYAFLAQSARASPRYGDGRRFESARRLEVSEVFPVARDHATVVERVRFPPLTPGPSSPTWQRRHVQSVEVPGSNPGRGTQEHWPSGYGSALLRRTSGNRCEGSSPSCSARDGWPRW
jgi:hypothetical protein